MIENIKQQIHELVQKQTSQPMFDFGVMECADPDNLVFLEKESEHSWTFYQITNLKLLSRFEGYPDHFIEALYKDTSVNDELGHNYSIVTFTADLDYESQDTVDRLKNVVFKDCPDNWKYLSCESIFHEDATESIIRNVLKQDPHYYD